MIPFRGLPDEQLVARAQEGIQEAFDVLYRRHQAWVHSCMAGFCACNASETEDLSQEVFAKAFASLQALTDGKGFVPWTRTIARNVGIDFCRRQARAAYLQRRGVVPNGESPDVRFEPSQMLDSTQIVEELRRAIGSLPESQREVVMKRYFANMKLEQIAVALGCPVGTIKSRLHAALATIRHRGESQLSE